MNQRQLRLKSLVQAPPKEEYPNDIYEFNNFSVARQIESEISFDGNWWYIWFKGNVPIEEGQTIKLDRNYLIEEIHIYKNYKRGTMLLS